MSGMVRLTRRRPPTVPYVEIVLPIEGRATGHVRGCAGDYGIRDRVLDWIEHDPDMRDLVDAFRRLRDRQAA